MTDDLRYVQAIVVCGTQTVDLLKKWNAYASGGRPNGDRIRASFEIEDKNKEANWLYKDIKTFIGELESIGWRFVPGTTSKHSVSLGVDSDRSYSLASTGVMELTLG